MEPFHKLWDQQVKNMSYRRSYGGYRRSYGGSRRSSGGRVRRTIKASMSVGSASLTTQALAIPVDSTRNVGIQIHEFRAEVYAASMANAIMVATKYTKVWLNRNTPSAERYISDIDSICTLKHYCATAVGNSEQIFMTDKYSPPIPIFQDEIRMCAYQDSGQTWTVCIEVAYTLAWMTVGQIIGVAKNIII